MQHRQQALRSETVTVKTELYLVPVNLTAKWGGGGGGAMPIRSMQEKQNTDKRNKGGALSSQRGWCPARSSSKGGGGRAVSSQWGWCPARGSSKGGEGAVQSNWVVSRKR